MSKILVESDEYFNVKNKLNELLEINRSLKEKYTRLQKRSTIDTGYSIEKIDKIKNENISLKKDITLFKQENSELKKTKARMLKDITLYKQENDLLTNENKRLNIMLEEYTNSKKSSKNSPENKKEFNIDEFNKEYEEFIEKLKQNKNETI